MALAPRAGSTPKSGWLDRRSGDSAAPAGPESAVRSAEIAMVRDFNALCARYEKPLFNLIYQWIGDYEEAADLTQETFISAYRAREQFRGDSRVYTWLYRIAHNHCKNRFKQRDRQRELEGMSLDAGVDPAGDGESIGSFEIADWTYSPEQLLERKELKALVDRAINALAAEYKVVLVLREFESLSYNEIAEVTGLTLEAVKTRLNRARNMVRQRIDPYLRT